MVSRSQTLEIWTTHVGRASASYNNGRTAKGARGPRHALRHVGIVPAYGIAPVRFVASASGTSFYCFFAGGAG